MTHVINLYGGPGSGKSTSAAYLFFAMKKAGRNVELVREYVKDWAWEGRKINTYDQLYFMGKQLRRESLLYGKVDAIVTDSPVFQSAFYAKKYAPPFVAAGVASAVAAYYKQAAADGHKHHHVFLRRSKPYNPHGRYETHEQAIAIDSELLDALVTMGAPVVNCHTDEDALDVLLGKTVGIHNPDQAQPTPWVHR